VSGSFTIGGTAQCGSATSATLNLVAGRAYLIRQPAAAGGPASVIIVGSHNPTAPITLKNGCLAAGCSAGVPGPCPAQQSTPKSNNWVSVPYHTTAINAQDLCNSMGLSQTGGPLVPKALIQIPQPDNAGVPFLTAVCGTGAALTTNLVLGRGVNIREPVTGDGVCNTPVKSIIPAHF
jgi:hypothetical protein